MKEEQIDNYIGKLVELTDFENTKRIGLLFKIKNGVAVDYPIKNYLCDIKSGYLLMWTNTNDYIFRKSHIKKLKQIKIKHIDWEIDYE